MILGWPNLRSALDARTALCFHSERHWPGASESDRSVTHNGQQQMRKLALALTVTVIAFVGCSTPSPSSNSPSTAAAVTDLGTVAVNDGDWYHCSLSGGRECRVCLRALADRRVLVQAVVLRTDAQGQIRILARPRTIANPGQKVSLPIGEGSLALIPEVKPAAN